MPTCRKRKKGNSHIDASKSAANLAENTGIQTENVGENDAEKADSSHRQLPEVPVKGNHKNNFNTILKKKIIYPSRNCIIRLISIHPQPHVFRRFIGDGFWSI